MWHFLIIKYHTLCQKRNSMDVLFEPRKLPSVIYCFVWLVRTVSVIYFNTSTNINKYKYKQTKYKYISISINKLGSLKIFVIYCTNIKLKCKILHSIQNTFRCSCFLINIVLIDYFENLQ